MSLLMKRRGGLRPKDSLERREAEARSRRRRRNRLRTIHLQSQQQILMLLLYRGRWISNPPQQSLRHANSYSFMRHFGPSDWLDRFRMSKDTFIYLCDQLRSRLRRPGLSPEQKLGIALWRLSSRTQCPLLRTKLGVSRKVVYKCVKEVCQAVITVLKPIYLHPPGLQALGDKARIFNARWGFPHCVGALGTLRIPLTTHARNNDLSFLVLHSVVDGQGLLWEACASFPGGMGITAILENSFLWEMAREGRLQAAPKDTFLGKAQNYFLLGDASYPLQDWLLTPYPQGCWQNQQRARFNLRLERARSVAEIALLRLRARWQCLLAPLGYNLVPTLALACCVLHNMCETHEQRFDPRWLEGVETEESPCTLSPLFCSPHADARAEWLRDMVCGYFESQVEG
ncbi:uncharacterized protein WCC33_019296 [Rhinophrynus dorsalis]